MANSIRSIFSVLGTRGNIRFYRLRRARGPQLGIQGTVGICAVALCPLGAGRFTEGSRSWLRSPLLWGRTDRRVLPPRGIIVQSCNARRTAMILGCGNEQLNPAGHPAVGLDSIIVIATLDGYHVLDVAHGSTREIPSATVSSGDTY